MIGNIFTDAGSLQMAVEQSIQTATHIVLAIAVIIMVLLRPS